MRAQATSSFVGPLLQLFFAEHLVVHKRASVSDHRLLP